MEQRGQLGNPEPFHLGNFMPQDVKGLKGRLSREFK